MPSPVAVVPVPWVLAQADLAVSAAAPLPADMRGIELVLTTELPEPFEWLSGGELLLTTGIQLPSGSVARRQYIHALRECGVAAVGFGVGLSHKRVPAELLAAADAAGLPILQIPRPTPFAAVIKRVSQRLAEVQYDEVVRVFKTQPKMTRAAATDGAGAVVRELGSALGADVVMLDPAGGVLVSRPARIGADALAQVREGLDRVGGPTGGRSEVRTGVFTDAAGHTVTFSRISLGRSVYGNLAVLSAEPLPPVAQILLGHATSLLALEYDRPARMRRVQVDLNGKLLRLALGDAGVVDSAWMQLRDGADRDGQVRMLCIDSDSPAALSTVADTIGDVLAVAGMPTYQQHSDQRMLLMLPARGARTLAHRIVAQLDGRRRKQIRAGISGPHQISELPRAVDDARLAATAATLGGAPVDFGSMAGRALLSVDASRQVLRGIADSVLSPLSEYDAANGTDLVAALRAFLEANGHWESAAAAASVHRHTLRKRIETVESVLEVNLDVARVRAELLLAMMAQAGER